MSGGEQKGRWGHTRDPLKSDPRLLFFFFGWGVTSSTVAVREIMQRGKRARLPSH